MLSFLHTWDYFLRSAYRLGEAAYVLFVYQNRKIRTKARIITEDSKNGSNSSTGPF